MQTSFLDNQLFANILLLFSLKGDLRRMWSEPFIVTALPKNLDVWQYFALISMWSSFSLSPFFIFLRSPLIVIHLPSLYIIRLNRRAIFYF